MPITKPLVHQTKTCSTEFEVQYEDDIPYLRCPDCNHEIKDWIKWRKEYSSYYKDPEKWNQKKDHMMCIMGYFCDAFRKAYGEEFSMSLNEKGLFRGQEFNVLRRVYAAMEGNAQTVKSYIDWFFEEKLKRRKKKLTSLASLAYSPALNEFKFYRRKQATITRDRQIPQKIKDWIMANAPAVLDNFTLEDFGDLKSLLIVYKSGQLQLPDLSTFVTKLVTAGLVDGVSFDIIGWQE